MASGQTLVSMTGIDGVGPATNFATLDTRNAHPVLDFDATTEEAAYFEFVLPSQYGGGGLTVFVHWLATSAVSGGVTWGGSLERQAEAGDDLDADSFATEQTATETTNATSGKVIVTPITFTNGTNMDSLAVSESARLKIARKVADGGDDMTGDAELLKIEIRET
jgi:hypothetical protein